MRVLALLLLGEPLRTTTPRCFRCQPCLIPLARSGGNDGGGGGGSGSGGDVPAEEADHDFQETLLRFSGAKKYVYIIQCKLQLCMWSCVHSHFDFGTRNSRSHMLGDETMCLFFALG